MRILEIKSELIGDNQLAFVTVNVADRDKMNAIANDWLMQFTKMNVQTYGDNTVLTISGEPINVKNFIAILLKH